MLIGEYEVNVGEKNRLAVPKKLRDQFKGKVILTRGYENSLIIVDQPRWETVLKQINKSILFSKESRDLKRYLIGGSLEIEMDAQGRFVLPEPLKQSAKINDKVVFIGVDDWIEIWSLEIWKEEIEDLKVNLNEFTKKLSE